MASPDWSPKDVQVVSSVEQLRALLDRKRLTILRMLAQRPMTVTQIADELGLVPASIHYHVKVLERAALVELVDTKERSGILEKYYGAIAHDFVVDPALGHTAQAPAYALEAIVRDMRAASSAIASAPVDDTTVLTAQLGAARLTPDKAREFAHRLEQLIAEFMAGGDEGDDTLYSMALALYPVPGRAGADESGGQDG
ncbi:MAG: hypothetical protein BWY85_01848 [Firmicutes bacterium ADurb.Bin506]|nr:MAG: hypothetical protein BWY85_01848 [Firmicutes bacterium ADurb.Bin506]